MESKKWKKGCGRVTKEEGRLKKSNGGREVAEALVIEGRKLEKFVVKE